MYQDSNALAAAMRYASPACVWHRAAELVLTGYSHSRWSSRVAFAGCDVNQPNSVDALFLLSTPLLLNGSVSENGR